MDRAVRWDRGMYVRMSEEKIRRHQVLFNDIRTMVEEAGGEVDFARKLGVSFKSVYRWVNMEVMPSPLVIEKLIRLKHKLPLTRPGG